MSFLNLVFRKEVMLRVQKLNFLEQLIFLNIASQFHGVLCSTFRVGRETLLRVNANAFSHENVMASDSCSYILTGLLEYFAKGHTVFKS